MLTLWQDFRYTLRQLRNAPVFALTAVLTLALGLGATTAMLAIVDSVLVRPVALPHAERIVSITRTAKGHQDSFTYKDFQAIQSGVRSFATVAVDGMLPAPVTTADGTRMVGESTVSGDFFAVAGMAARLGRVLTDADAHAPVAVASYAFWKNLLHSDPRAVGASVKIGGRAVTIIGVMPPEFAFLIPPAVEVLYTPFSVNAKGENQHGFTNVDIHARLKPGATVAAAAAEVRAVYAHTGPQKAEDRGQVVLSRLQEEATKQEQPAIYALVGASALLLLIACANAANLQIARAVTRTGEMSVRAALGASRGRLLRQIATESVTVSLLGAVLGLVLADGAVHWARHAYGEMFARFNELALHPEVFAGCALLAIVAGLLAALAPASAAMRHAEGLPFSQAARVTRRSRLTGSLIGVEIALTCVLLVTAGLFIRTFRALEEAPLGFNPHHVTEITLMPLNPQEDTSALVQTYDRLLARLRSLPGIEAAATQTSMPFSDFSMSLSSDFQIAGRPRRTDNTINISLIDVGYTRTLGVPVLRGRGFVPTDRTGSQPVGLVNETFVRRYLNGGNALGKVLEFPKAPNAEADTRVLKQPLTIIGILPDEIAYRTLGEPPAPTLFVPYRQFAAGSPSQMRFAFGIAPQFAIRWSLPQATIER